MTIQDGITLPLPSISDSLHEADPLLTLLLALLPAAINYELAGSTSAVQAGSPWAVAAAGTPLAGVLPVADVAWRPPTQAQLAEACKTFPLLAIYRTGERAANDFSTEVDSVESVINLDYLLSPLTAEGVQRIAGALPIVSRIIRNVFSEAGHDAYESGSSVLRNSTLGVSELRIDGQVQYGPAALGSDGNNLEFWALSMTLVATELMCASQTGGVPFLGAWVDLEYGESAAVVRVDSVYG